MSRNNSQLNSIIRLVLFVVSLVFAMRHKKIHGCDTMNTAMQKIALDAITILSHIGKYDEEVMGYARILLSRYEGAINE